MKRVARTALVSAAMLGGTHAAFSIYWSLGGTYLLASLRTGLLESLGDRRWVLAPVGAVKLLDALAPLLLAARGWPVRRLSRGVCWVGKFVLVSWGGAKTVVGNLVLAGAIHPTGGLDRPGMLGHAYLWDPLFLLWGLALAVGLRASARRRWKYAGRTRD